jgi:hypothetical protein
MNAAHVWLSAVLLTTGSQFPARAHSWYPMECCSNHDCVPAHAILTDDHGGKIVVVGQTQIPIPDDFKVRSSPDGRIHVCFRTVAGEQYGGPNFLPICLFVPAQS